MAEPRTYDLFECEPYRAKIMRGACAKRYLAANAPSSHMGTRTTYAHCIGCEVGARHAAGTEGTTAPETPRRRGTATRTYTLDGVTRTHTEWARRLRIHPYVLDQRFAAGWDERRALTTPRVPDTQRPGKAGRRYTLDGVSKTVAEWASDVGVSYNTMYDRLCRRGWSVRRALTAPKRARGDREEEARRHE